MFRALGLGLKISANFKCRSDPVLTFNHIAGLRDRQGVSAEGNLKLPFDLQADKHVGYEMRCNLAPNNARVSPCGSSQVIARC